jgi:hypothetical protein
MHGVRGEPGTGQSAFVSVRMPKVIPPFETHELFQPHKAHLMNLQQLHDTAASRSYFSRPDSEVWSGINSGSRWVYQAVLNEDQQFFRTQDTSSVTIIANTQEYALPTDCIQLLRVRERLNAQDAWRKIDPIDLQDSEASNDAPAPQLSLCSSFTYEGPYLKQASADDGLDDEIYSIFINPIPQSTRQVELIYTAKYLEVGKGTDPFVIPGDLRDVVLDFAVAELLRANNDDLADKYMASAQNKLDMALTLIRDRQLQHLTTVTPYLSEYL